MSKRRFRAPPPVTLDLLGETRTVQVNHCKMPECGNFGLPARHAPQGHGPSAERDSPSLATCPSPKGGG